MKEEHEWMCSLRNGSFDKRYSVDLSTEISSTALRDMSDRPPFQGTRRWFVKILSVFVSCATAHKMSRGPNQIGPWPTCSNEQGRWFEIRYQMRRSCVCVHRYSHLRRPCWQGGKIHTHTWDFRSLIMQFNSITFWAVFIFFKIWVGHQINCV